MTVVPEEAEVVRQIFRLFCDGHGEKSIAKLLNASRPVRNWRPNTIYLMLQNSKYVGRFYFNRRQWQKDPATGRRVFRWRSPEHWERLTRDDLRIVDEDTWEAVQRRLRTRQHLFSRRRTATKHLLSGLLLCDRCGGRLSIVAKDYYACRNHTESGTCSNDLRIRREALEEVVIGQIGGHLVEWVEALRTAATQERPEGRENPDAEREKSLKELRKRAEGVMDAIRRGRLHGRALEEAMATYQEVWDEVERLERETRGSAQHQVGGAEIRYDRSVVEDFVARLPEALRTDLTSGREFIHETLKWIRIAPGDDRPRECPVCRKVLGKLTPQHLVQHGLTLTEGYKKFPELGFTKRARLMVQPSPQGLLQTGEVFGLLVAGARFELWKRTLTFEFFLTY